MLKKVVMISSILVSMASISSVSAAGDVAAGKAKAAACAACHGPAGISAIPLFPNLAGQQYDYLVKQLKAFKTKTRVDPTMNGMAAGLSDADIENLAAYFHSLK